MVSQRRLGIAICGFGNYESRIDIEFVYFDLGNVLVSFDPEIACNNVVERFGIDVGQAKAAIFESGIQDRFEHGPSQR